MAAENDKRFTLEEPRNANETEKGDEKIWKEFVSTSTIHGLHYVFDQRPRQFRVIWVLIVLGQFGLFVWQGTSLVTSYFQYKVTSKIRVIHNNPMTFPAITICNENMYRKSAIKGTDLEKILKEENPLYGTKKGPIKWETYNVGGINMTELVREAAHKLRYNKSTKTGMLYSCKWSGKNCSAENFTETMTEMGLCYTFNSGKKKESHIVTGPGDQNGFKMIMSVDQEEYMGFMTHSAGLRILLHNQDELPLVRDFGFSVMPRSHVYASISKHRMISLPSPYETMCKDQTLPMEQPYSKSACFEYCKERFVVSRCGCRAFYMADDGDPVCNMSSYLECVKNALSHELFDDVEKAKCGCTEPCDVTFYRTSLSYGQFPSLESMKEYNGSEDLGKLENDLLAIDLYFERLDFNTIEQVPVYDRGSLVGEFGGLLGLFLGASLTTIIEILYFLLQVIFSSLACPAQKQ